MNIKKIQAQVTAGMVANAQQLQASLKSWEKYRPIWLPDKDMMIQAYNKPDQKASDFDTSIQRYAVTAAAPKAPKAL